MSRRAVNDEIPTICVQSVDGALFFLKQDIQLFQIQLPGFLIPGPLAHIPENDCLVIANSNLELECYRYMKLKSSTNNDVDKQKSQQETKDAASIKPEWVANLGESVMHLVIHQNRYSSKYDVVAACEQTFFILTPDEGTIRYQRRLEF